MPWLRGSLETCTSKDLGPPGKVLYVAVFAYTDISDISLVCTVATGKPAEEKAAPPKEKDPDAIPLEDNVWSSYLFGSALETLEFKFEVPPGAVSVRAEIRHGMGEAELYASFDRQNAIGLGEPTNGCVSGKRYSDQVCEEKLHPIGKVLYVSVHGKTDFVYARVRCVAYF